MRESKHDMIFRSGNANQRSCGNVLFITCFLLFLFLPVAVAGVNCTDVDVSPVADFRYEIVPAETAPIKVNFYSTSDGGRNDKGGLTDPVESFTWRFGDGDVSEKTNPSHIFATSSARYQAADTPFEVTLTVKTECGRSGSTTKKVFVYCLNQTAGFTIIQPAGEGPYTAPVALFIKDMSLHVNDAVTTYHYTLWDSGMTRLFKESSEKDPTFIIRNGGRYVIRQEVFKGCSNPPAPDTEMKKDIEVTGSVSADAIPMETIPFTITVPENPATAPQVATPAASASRTTAPALMPPVSSPGTGTLSVVTSPAGAQVFVNDILLGLSPTTIPELKAGSYILRLELSGYRKKTVPFVIEEGKITEYATALEPDSGVSGMVPIVAAVVILAAGAGAVYLYRKRKKPVKSGVDWNNP